LELGLDTVDAGLREASDIITGTLPHGASARVLPNGFTLKPVQFNPFSENVPPDFLAKIRIASWRQTPCREELLLCGKVAVSFPELGLTIRACDFVLHPDGRPRVNLPKRQFLTDDGPVIGFCASFDSHETRRAFGDAVWRLLRTIHPDLEQFAP
jgi:hypothetical protein